MEGVIYRYTLGGKYYVGKTYMQQRKRMGKHKYEALTLQKDHPFSRAIRKYGWDEAKESYEVLEVVEAKDKQTLNSKLIERESYWIEESDSKVPNGYNIYTKGQERIPHTYNKEEIYSRVSKSLKGKYMNHPSTSRRVYCVEQKKWYPSISEAERVNNLSRGCVEKAASGKNVHAGGLTWNYTGEDKEARTDLLRSQRKELICVDTGQTFESIYAAATWLFGKENVMKKKSMLQNALRHNRRTCGYKFEYLNK